MSFQWQRDTEGSGWQPSAVPEAAMQTPLMLVGAPQHTQQPRTSAARQRGLEIPMPGSCC